MHRASRSLRQAGTHTYDSRNHKNPLSAVGHTLSDPSSSPRVRRRCSSAMGQYSTTSCVACQTRTYTHRAWRGVPNTHTHTHTYTHAGTHVRTDTGTLGQPSGLNGARMCGCDVQPCRHGHASVARRRAHAACRSRPYTHTRVIHTHLLGRHADVHVGLDAAQHKGLEDGVQTRDEVRVQAGEEGKKVQYRGYRSL
jgi:hypothetical protein